MDVGVYHAALCAPSLSVLRYTSGVDDPFDRRFPVTLFLAACCAVLFLLWLPQLHYPILSDTAIYALLGKSVFTQGQYLFFGEPYAKHLPLQAIASYPLTAAFGFQLGMKLSTLLAGWGTLIMGFLIVRRQFSLRVALLGAVALLFHPAFVLMTTLGSADLLFGFLFLASVYAYLRAADDTRWYLAAFGCIGLSCLARYNGLPVLPLYLVWTVWKRPEHLREKWFLLGGVLGIALAVSWFVRNAIVFGSPFHSEYTVELGAEAPNPVHQVIKNFFYYLNPVHNLFPFVFPLAIWGLIQKSSKQSFLLACIGAIWVLTAIWWVQAMRFAFPAFPLLLGFAGAGFYDILRRFPKWTAALWIIAALGFIAVHAPALCLYTYGACNAAFDRTVGLLPKNLGLSPEGFYSWNQARTWIDVHAETGATLITDDGANAGVWQTGVFRKDIRIVPAFDDHCPAYRITTTPVDNETSVFVTTDSPVTHVARRACVTGSL